MFEIRIEISMVGDNSAALGAVTVSEHLCIDDAGDGRVARIGAGFSHAIRVVVCAMLKRMEPTVFTNNRELDFSTAYEAALEKLQDALALYASEVFGDGEKPSESEAATFNWEWLADRVAGQEQETG